jgi:hypothetical protein
MARHLNSTLLSGLLLTGLGLLGIFVLIPFGIDPPYSAVQFEALSPAYWPRIVCYALAMIGCALVVSGWLSTHDAVATDQAARVGADPTPDPRRIARPLVALIICFGLYASLDVLGFVLGCTLALAALMLLAGERRLHVVLPTSISTPLALHLFFTKAASVPIPSGLLEPLLTRL